MDVTLLVRLDFNDEDDGYILYRVSDEELCEAKSCVLIAKHRRENGTEGKMVEELIEEEFSVSGIRFEPVTYDVLDLYMF